MMILEIWIGSQVFLILLGLVMLYRYKKSINQFFDFSLIDETERMLNKFECRVEITKIETKTEYTMTPG